MAMQLEQIEDLLPTLRSQYHRFLLVAGSTGSGETPLLKALCRRQEFPYLIVKVADRLPPPVLQEDASLLMYFDNALMRRTDGAAEAQPEQGRL